VTALMQDAEARGRLGRGAAGLAAKYGWPLIGAKFGKILQRVIGERLKDVPGHANASENHNATLQPGELETEEVLRGNQSTGVAARGWRGEGS
jgi:hypothetical protein